MSNRIPETEHFWAAEANYQAADKLEGYPIRPYPLLIQTPVTALVAEGNPAVLHRYARQVTCNCELCFVVAKAAYDVPEEQAHEYVGEYRVLAAFRDFSTLDHLGPDAPDREKLVWQTYLSRWGDSTHCLSTAGLPAKDGAFPNAAPMRVSIDGLGEMVANTADYLHRAPAIISFLSRIVSLQPGDVISLGKAGEVLTIPANLRLPEGTVVHASIGGVGELVAAILDLRQQREVKPSNFWWL